MGKAVEGHDRSTEFCNEDVACEAPLDCLFSDWQAWSACSTSCNGVKHRSRSIGRYGRGDGKWCLGDLKQAAPCNAGSTADGLGGVPGCGLPEKVDCKTSHWGEWGTCSSECGGGQHSRYRDVAQNP